MSRDEFENVLGGMARAGLVRMDDAVFEKAGRQIPYRTARLTPAGLEFDARSPVELVMKEDEPPPVPRKRKRKVGGRAGETQVRRGDPYSPPGSPPLPGLAKKATRPTRAMAGPQVEEALRAWRLVQARRHGVPAFRILTDRALSGLVSLRPSTTAEMLTSPASAFVSRRNTVTRFAASCTLAAATTHNICLCGAQPSALN